MTVSTSAVFPSLSPPVARRRFYALGLLVPVGFVVPNAMLVLHIAQSGIAPSDYFGAWVASLPAAQLLVDLVICSLAFTLWAAVDGPRLGVRRWWLVIPATCLVGLCFAIPLYLLMREKALSATQSAEETRA